MDILNAYCSYFKRFVSVEHFCWFVFLMSLFLLALHLVQHGGQLRV